MKTIKAEELDKKFDDAEDISAYIDTDEGERVNSEETSIDLDLPVWIINKIDFEAHKRGISREALIVAIIKKSLDRHEPKER